MQCADCRFSFCPNSRGTSYIDGTNALQAVVQRHGPIKKVLAQVFQDVSSIIRSVSLADWDSDGTVRLEPLRSGAEAEEGNLSAGPYAKQVVLAVGQLEASPSPLRSIASLRTSLTEDDIVVFIFSDVRHTGADVGSRDWEKLLGERHVYLDTQTALKMLFRAGFRACSVTRLRRRLPILEWMQGNIQGRVQNNWQQRVLRRFPAFLLRSINVTVLSSDVAIVAKRRSTEQPVVSVIIPVFDEAATAATVIDSVLRVKIDGARVEAIVVESNSTDGSHEIVQRYATHPHVTCIFEDRPQGKGHAIRSGLSQARGDILMIQDADLEYDFEDYHSLIEPILRGREAFVLGSRHGGRNHWKLRRFAKPLLTKAYNLAHVLVTAYINLLFSLHLRDPQTMFKVFRRDCIEGIAFSGNYFDFDYELLLKIVRKGYQPVEVPVNYRSRSHAEGKKIRMWRDAPLGLWMIAKLRFTPLARFLKSGECVD